jgi:hypothetical protein
MSRRFLLVVALAGISALLVACKAYDPLYCDANKPCTDPDRPFCDLNGEFEASEGIARTCIPEPDVGGNRDDAAPSGPDASFCVASDFLQCTDSHTAIYCDEQGSQYITVDCGSECNPDEQGCFCEPDTSSCASNQTIHCGNDGRVEEIENCSLGCNNTAERCVDVKPSNELGEYLDLTDDAPIVALTNGAVIDTDAGTIEDGDGSMVEVPQFQVTPAEGGVPIRLFAVKSLTIGDTIVIGTRALAIVSDRNIEVRGHLRVMAGEVTTGDCLGAVGDCDGPTGPFYGVCGGGGGGGFGTIGGSGGDGSAGSFEVAGGSGGAAQGDLKLVPLRGGCPGSGSGGTASPGAGGHGGGAIQLVSRVQILVEDGPAQAYIDAGGRASGGASGGGSGGGILLESPRVVVASGAAVVANGAGGGSVPEAGEDGSLNGSPADGGAANPPLFAAGGNGGIRGSAAAAGSPIASSTLKNIYHAGAGGGAVGRIRVNVPLRLDFADAGHVSPTASVGTLATR